MEEGNSSMNCDTDEPRITREQLEFHITGAIISKNRDTFMGRALNLLKVIVGVNYDTWKDVPPAKKSTIWKALLKTYDIPYVRQSSIMLVMGSQVRAWKKNLRATYFKGLDSAAIRALREFPPEKEGIPKHAWAKFIDRESSEAKMVQRSKNKVNRQKKVDVHCSGRTSNAQISETLRKEGKPHSRTHVYLHGRRQRKKNGMVHPKVAATVEKIEEIQKSQAENNIIPMSLDDDPVGQVCGPEKRGPVRGMTQISKTKLNHLGAVQPLLDEFLVQKSEMQEMKGSLDTLVGLVQSLVKDRDRLNTSAGASAATVLTAPAATPSPGDTSLAKDKGSNSGGNNSTPNSNNIERFWLYGFSHGDPIAVGDANPKPTPGAIVHHRPLLDTERRVSIIKVVEGMENEPLYLRTQGGSKNIGELVGAFVAWPIALMRLV